MQRKGKFCATVVALLGVIAVVAGCGGGGGSTDATTGGGDASLTKAEFVKQGDLICQTNYTKRGRVLAAYLAKAKEQGAAPPMAQQEALLVNRILPFFQEESEELNELGLPTSDAKKAEAVLRALEEAIAAVEAEPDVAVRKGTAVQFARAEHLAHSYGFEYCGRS
jgi:hypothetical protein